MSEQKAPERIQVKPYLGDDYVYGSYSLPELPAVEYVRADIAERDLTAANAKLEQRGMMLEDSCATVASRTAKLERYRVALESIATTANDEDVRKCAREALAGNQDEKQI